MQPPLGHGAGRGFYTVYDSVEAGRANVPNAVRPFQINSDMSLSSA
jgi:hypothetical protein